MFVFLLYVWEFLCFWFFVMVMYGSCLGRENRLWFGLGGLGGVVVGWEERGVGWDVVDGVGLMWEGGGYWLIDFVFW